MLGDFCKIRNLSSIVGGESTTGHIFDLFEIKNLNVDHYKRRWNVLRPILGYSIVYFLHWLNNNLRVKKNVERPG